MSRRPRHLRVLSGSERHDAKQLGAVRYVKGKRYKKIREELFELLDAAVAAMRAAKYLNPYDGRIVGAYATVFVGEDTKSLEFLVSRKVAAMGDDKRRPQLMKYIGLLIAEDFLRAHEAKVPVEPLIAPPGPMRKALGAIMDTFRGGIPEAVARADADEVEPDEEIGPPPEMRDMAGNIVRFTPAETRTEPADRNDEYAELAARLISDQLGTYESMVAATDAADEVPKEVERRALAKAAFLRLHVQDLEDIFVTDAPVGADEDEDEDRRAAARQADLGGFGTKEALAQALSEKFRNELERVAEIILHREEGNPEHGLITRLIPLKEAPDLGSVHEAFEALRGHYIEIRTAVFFLFGRVGPVGDVLRVRGRIRSFTISPDEAGGAANMSPRTHDEEVVITLHPGAAWAEVNARRASDANTIRTVLRRTGEMTPAGSVKIPAPLQRDPGRDWDPRTVWMLDFMRRDLQADTLKLENVLVASFKTPDDPLARQARRRRPRVDSVQLRGDDLHRHPDACTHIVGGSHLRELEFRVRHGRRTDIGMPLVRFRVQWEGDHLAVLTGAAEGQKPDATLHRRIVGLVRHAAERPLDEDGLAFMLRQVQRASENELSDTDDEYFGEEPPAV